MSLYTGLKCKVCDKSFIEEDDIVVCPDCGTPYHRSCYKEKGECISYDLHEKKQSYSVNEEKAKKIGDTIICEKCGTHNKSLSIFCEKCGNPITIEKSTSDERNVNADIEENPFPNLIKVDYNDKYCGFDPNEDFDGATTAELAEFIGDNNKFFLPIFKLMKERKKKGTFNLSALLCPPAYFAYRKMTGTAILSLIIQITLWLPSIIYFLGSMISKYNMPDNALVAFISTIDINSPLFMVIYNVGWVLGYVFIFYCASMANHIYYRFAVKRIKFLKSKKALNEKNIKRFGRTSNAGLTIMIIAYAIIAFLLTFAIAFVS